MPVQGQVQPPPLRPVPGYPGMQVLALSNDTVQTLPCYQGHVWALSNDTVLALSCYQIRGAGGVLVLSNDTILTLSCYVSPGPRTNAQTCAVNAGSPPSSRSATPPPPLSGTHILQIEMAYSTCNIWARDSLQYMQHLGSRWPTVHATSGLDMAYSACNIWIRDVFCKPISAPLVPG